MRRRDAQRAALVLHLFHDDVALDLIERVKGLGADVDVIATGPRLSQAVASSLAGLPRADWVETRNHGFDVAPFLSVIQLLERRGYDLVCKLHTKRGNSGFGRQWREALLDSLIGSAADVTAIVEAFAVTPDLAMVGPAGLYLSAAANMTANADRVRRLAPLVFPALDLPADWGFFAGTMFWTRVAHLKPFGRIGSDAEGWEDGGKLRDGGIAHAVERLFGLIPVAAGGSVGLRGGRGSALRLTRDAGAPVEILEALARLGRPSPVPRLTRAERNFVRNDNPLLHYLASGGADPHPLLAGDWYARRNDLPAGTPPLAHFLAQGAMAPDPSPLFHAADYVKRRPWLRRRNVNPLVHHVLEAEALGEAEALDRPAEPARPRAAPTDPFARAARLQQLRAFMEGREALSFAVRIGASRNSPTEWGDVHFAAGLAGALTAAGSDARVEYREDWHRRRETADVVICLRGPVRHEPRPDAVNILWIISHPDQVSFEEMAEYDLVYVASESFAALLRHWIDVPVLSLLQATDTTRFMPTTGATATGGLFFAGNTRGQDRPVVRWAIELGLPIEVYGSGWQGALPARSFRGERIPNTELPGRYAAATAVLGDHWPAMRDFGFVSNRIFDVLAAGGTPVTDAFPAIAAAVGKAAIQIGARDELRGAVARARARPLASRLAHAARVRRDHGFAARAATISDDLRGFVSGSFRSPLSRRGPRVHLAYDPGDAQAAWMVARRLLGPLTTDEAGVRSLTVGAPDAPLPMATDIVIAMPGAASSAGAWDALAEAVGTRTVVVDCGALSLRSRRLPPRLGPLLAVASQVWWPAEQPSGSGPRRGRDSHVVPDSVDPRLWRDYHRARQWDFASALRCVLVAGDGIGPDLLATLSAAFAGTQAELTIVERAPSGSGPWTTVPFPTGKSAYAAFARWLRAQDFHAGLCVAGTSGSRGADLAFLDFSAAGLVSIAPAELLPDPDLTARALVVPVAGDWSDLGDVLARLARAPGSYAGVAAASAAHVWRARSAAAAGTVVRTLLDT